tara:strand:- start:4212 stop:4535 length:324 start_codon:yes stop_codon:yes gene_type:complete
MVKLVAQLNKVARSQPFHFLVYAAAAFQVYKIALDRSAYCGGMFLLTAAIGCQFTKNRALCLLAGLVVTNFVVGCSKIVEGLSQEECEEQGQIYDEAADACIDPVPI